MLCQIWLRNICKVHDTVALTGIWDQDIVMVIIEASTVPKDIKRLPPEQAFLRANNAQLSKLHEKKHPPGCGRERVGG